MKNLLTLLTVAACDPCPPIEIAQDEEVACSREAIAAKITETCSKQQEAELIMMRGIYCTTKGNYGARSEVTSINCQNPKAHPSPEEYDLCLIRNDQNP